MGLNRGAGLQGRRWALMGFLYGSLLGRVGISFLCIVEWYCLCKSSGESMDHLLLHCDFVQALWSLIFCLFGLNWVMLAQVVDLMACWMGVFRKSWVAGIWGLIPSCIMWLIWRERNRRLFEDPELTPLELKSILLRSIFGCPMLILGLFVPPLRSF